MVRILTLMGWIACGCMTSVAFAIEITPESLRAEAKDQNKQSRLKERRLKAHDLKGLLGAIDEVKEGFVYTSPTGQRYRGYQLPNAVVVPAIRGPHRTDRPACLANDGNLYPAKWTGDYLECHLPQAGLVVLQEGVSVKVVPMSSLEQESKRETINGEVKASKYARRGESQSSALNRGSVLTPPFIAGPQESQPLRESTGSTLMESTGNDVSGTGSQGVRGGKESVTARPSRKSALQRNETTYIPPVRGGGSAEGVKTATVTVDKSKYGISFGTWIKAELDRNVTSADNGEIEITLRETVIGKYKTLDAGSILYGRKAFNTGTERMDISITRGISPDGDEISLNAIVHDDNRVSGLRGVIVRNRNEETVSAIEKGLFSAAGSAATGIFDSTPVGDGASSFTQEMLNTENKYLAKAPKATIYVSPQPLLLRVDRTF